MSRPDSTTEPGGAAEVIAFALLRAVELRNAEDDLHAMGISPSPADLVAWASADKKTRKRLASEHAAWIQFEQKESQSG